MTRKIPPNGLDLLKQAGLAVEVYPKDEEIPRAELLKKIRGCDGVLTLLTEKVDAEFFNAAGPRLKIVSNYAVGFDNFDLSEAKKRGVVLTNTVCPELTEAVAEFTFTLMMALAHRLVEFDNFTRAGKYHAWQPMAMLGHDLFGKTLGVVGVGRIGGLVARRAAGGLGMKVIYNNPEPDAALEKDTEAKFRQLPELLKEADVVSLHLPLLPSTRYLINEQTIKLMKPSAYLINTARGAIVKERALLQALYSSKLAGAALDVYECEPAIDCDTTDHLELKKLSNVILAPHSASLSTSVIAPWPDFDERGSLLVSMKVNDMAFLPAVYVCTQTLPSIR